MRDRTEEKQVLSPIPPDKQGSRGWTITLNGKVIEGEIISLELRNPRFGVLRYGSMDGKYDCWCYHENGGGDAMTIPFAIIQKELFIGVLEQERPLQGGLVMNIPRGFLRPHETASEGAIRELQEETGLPIVSELIELKGTPANSNSTFFNTALPGEGDRFFALLVDESRLKLIEEENPPYPKYHFRETFKPQSDDEEKIIRTIFIPWRTAARVSDMYTNAAVARLLARLITWSIYE